MKNIKLLIEYDGTEYQGWQTQNSALSPQPLALSKKKILTIQGILQEEIKKIVGEDVKLIASSRTDAGVHSLGLVASFKTRSYLEPQVIKKALNAVLPRDIRILEAEEAEMEFHPRYDAKGKSYFYLIANSNTSSAFFNKYVWVLPYKLDMKAMKKAGEMLVGKHDFSAFRGSGCGSKTTVRRISSLEVKALRRIDFMTAKFEGRFIRIRIEADAFLRHMVRNIVGTLVEVGRGRMTLDEVADALKHRDRKRTGPTAPAKGLFLERVKY